MALMQEVDALLLGRRTYVIHAEAFEPMAPGDPFGDMMNGPKKYVVSRTLKKPIWRDTTIIRDDVIEAVRGLKLRRGGASSRTAAASSYMRCSSTSWSTSCTSSSIRLRWEAASGCWPRASTRRSR